MMHEEGLGGISSLPHSRTMANNIQKKPMVQLGAHGSDTEIDQW